MRSLKGKPVRATNLLPAAILALGLGCGLVPSAAHAQFFGWGGGWGDGGGWGSMGPGQIYRAIGERGFRVIGPLRRNGAVFVADVIDRRGRRERLIVAAADAQILQRFVLDEPRAPGYYPRDAAIQPRDDLEGQMDREERGGLVPPAPIPDVGNRNQNFGYNNEGDVAQPVRPRPAPRVVKPVKPRIVERTPDALPQERDGAPAQPSRLKQKPSEPLRLPGNDIGHAADRPSEPAPATASRQPEPAAKPPSAPAPVQSPVANTAPAPTRMRDPLAIPGGEPKPANAGSEPPKASASVTNPAPARIVPGTVTGAPAAKAVAPEKPAAVQAPAKAGEVPVAPLD